MLFLYVLCWKCNLLQVLQICGFRRYSQTLASIIFQCSCWLELMVLLSTNFRGCMLSNPFLKGYLKISTNSSRNYLISTISIKSKPMRIYRLAHKSSLLICSWKCFPPNLMGATVNCGLCTSNFTREWNQYGFFGLFYFENMACKSWPIL